MAELRTEWICGECGVCCYKACRDPFPRPDGWKSDDLCTSCSRVVAGPISSDRRGDKKIEKAERIAAMEAAVKADPDRPNTEVKREFGVWGREVSEARKRLGLPPAVRGVPSEEVEAAIRANPDGLLKDIAAAAGVNMKRVSKVRSAMADAETSTVGSN